VALFHFVPDADDPAGIISRLTAPLASGSHLVISHFTADARADAVDGMEIYRRSGIEMASRTRGQVEALFAGFDLVDPGVVWVPQWRPDSPEDGDRPEASGVYAGVGRKR
jgi:S-adenosyl methyltransferase